MIGHTVWIDTHHGQDCDSGTLMEVGSNYIVLRRESIGKDTVYFNVERATHSYQDCVKCKGVQQ